MIKMKKASAVMMLVGTLLLNGRFTTLASEEVSVGDIITVLEQTDTKSSNLAERLVISDTDINLYSTVKKLIEEKGIEQTKDNYSWIEVPLDEESQNEGDVKLLEITQDQYATYLAYEFNHETYQLAYYEDETINKKITMYYGDEEYIYAQNYNNDTLSFGDSSELDQVEEEEQEDPVITELKEAKTQLQQRVDILAIVFSTFLFAFIMFLIWGKNLLVRK